MQERRQYSEEEYSYSTKIGAAIGFIIGWALGVAMVLYIDSPALNQWSLVPSIPIWNAIGWALHGMIVGSGGLLADLRFSPRAGHRVNRMLHLADKHAA
jgi:hypothetical protein